MRTPHSNKKIQPRAYNALVEALSTVYWFKQPWITYLKGLFHEAPGLLSAININERKRDLAVKIVERLMNEERKYQQLTIKVMLDVADMDSFPDLEKIEDREERDKRIQAAKRAVSELRKWTQIHQDIIDNHEQDKVELEIASELARKRRAFSESLGRLRQQFEKLITDNNPQERGREFESFIKDIFALFNLEPTAAFTLDREQIDGAFTFDTDDYILEAKWWKKPISRDQLDIFKAKIDRKGKNALGLFISVNGFTGDALKEYSDSTCFITMDGGDILAVLEERVRLDELLRRKKRHANETGNCYFPASKML